MLGWGTVLLHFVPVVNPPDSTDSRLRSRGQNEIIGKKRTGKKVQPQPVLGEQFILVQAVVGSQVSVFAMQLVSA